MRMKGRQGNPLDTAIGGNNIQWRREVGADGTDEWVGYDEHGKTQDEILAEYADRVSMFDSVAGVYQTADKIITGDDITVSVIDDKEMFSTAKTNGKDIVLNANLIDDLNSETITSLTGTNYHELSHILFTPRSGSAVGKWVKENKCVRAMNWLEESRAESLMVARYPSTRLFLEVLTTEYMLKGNPNEWGGYFPLTTGRKYLSLELRQIIADKFIAEHGLQLAKTINTIVNSYRRLVLPTDVNKAKEMINRLAQIIGYDDESPKMNQPTMAHGTGMMTKGKVESAKAQKDLQKKLGDLDKAFGDEELNEPTKTKQPTGVGGEGKYEGTTGDYTDEHKELAKKLEKRVSEIKNDKSFKREVNETHKAINKSDYFTSKTRTTQFIIKEPEAKAKIIARKFGQELERLVLDNEPMWDKNMPSGKLNVGRTMTTDVNAINTMFDVWDTGNENNDVEAVILMDSSGSMGWQMNLVCEANWIIKRGIERINGSVSTYSFNHESKLMYDRDTKAKPNEYRTVWSGGSTNPIGGLLEAERLLSTSVKPIKILFIITDGTWENYEVCDTIIDRLNKAGVLTALVYIGDYEDIKNAEMLARNENEIEQAEYYKQRLKELNHGVKVFKPITEMGDIVSLATKLVKGTLKRKVKN